MALDGQAHAQSESIGTMLQHLHRTNLHAPIMAPILSLEDVQSLKKNVKLTESSSEIIEDHRKSSVSAEDQERLNGKALEERSRFGSSLSERSYDGFVKYEKPKNDSTKQKRKRKKRRNKKERSRSGSMTQG